MLIFIVIISAAFSIMMLAFFAAAEVAVISVNKSRINLLAEGGGGILNAKIMNDLLKEHEMVISAMLLGVNFSIIFGTTVTTLALKYAVGDSMAVLATTLIMPPLFLVFGELVPKKVARLNADAFALKYVKVIRFFYNNFYFIIKHFTFLLSLIKGLIKATGKRNPTMTKEEIQYLIKISESEGVIKKTEGKMIDSVFSFNEMHLNDVMTPRNDVIAIQFGATLNDAIDLCIREGFSRIPVYEKSIDNIMGFLYVLDLIQHSQGLEGKTIKDFIRPVLFSPETKKIGMMLREMQKTKIHMSIVVDEYGQTAGVCTIEDVVEEIVGEIRDEYDVEEPEMVKINENVYLINAMMDIEDAASELGLDLSEVELEDVKTLGGFVISLLGRIPKPKDSVAFGNARFIVEKIDKHRIRQVKAVIKKQQAQTEGKDNVTAGK